MKLPVRPPELMPLLATELGTPAGIARFAPLLAAALGPAPGGKYRHWDTFRHAPPLTAFTAEQQWLAVKLARQALHRRLPLVDSLGVPFRFTLPNVALEYLHRIDLDAAGAIRGASQVTDPATRDTYLFRSLVEEAITSSQLEGASTTRKVAKEMIQEGRAPRDRSERMIFNNFRAMELVREIKGAPLTPEIVIRLQRELTADTLDDPSAAGRLRVAEDAIVISDETGTILHTPPPAHQLEERMRAMCAFANADGGGEFMPPAVRAILLHLWLAYDHPFVDGNGRTARALFYWSMAHQGYWLCEYVSISRILHQARSAYSRAYLYTESDENDATYFLLYQLRVLCRAIDDLHAFLARKTDQLRATEELVRRAKAVKGALNPRQLALLHHALRNPAAAYTIQSHRRSHGVTYETARTDLLGLERKKLLTKVRGGRLFRFYPAEDLRARLEERVRRKA